MLMSIITPKSSHYSVEQHCQEVDHTAQENTLLTANCARCAIPLAHLATNTKIYQEAEAIWKKTMLYNVWYRKPPTKSHGV